MAVVLSDNFNRSNRPIDGDAADTGQTWVVEDGGLYEINNERLEGVNQGLARVDAGVSEFELTATVNIPTTGGSSPVVVFLCQDVNSRIGVVFNDNATITLSATGASGWSNLHNSVGWAIGQNYQVRVRVEGPDITVWLDDVEVFTHTLSATNQGIFLESGDHTFVGMRGTGVFLDDLVVDDLQAAPDPTLATFGPTTPGGSSSDSNTDRVMVSLATPDSTGDVRTGHARLGLSGPGESSNAVFAIYADDGGTPGALLAESDQVAFDTEAATEYEFQFTGANQITVTAGTPYWIGPAWVDADPNDVVAVTVYRGTDEDGRYEQNWDPFDLPDPFGTPAAINAGPVDAWVTYAESEPERLPANPGEALWIGPELGKNHFNVGIGQPGGGTNHEDYDEDEIEDGFSQDPEFILTDDRSAVQFRTDVDFGTTTENTDYPRTELRELDENGDLADWDGGVDEHRLWGRSRATHLAAEKPWVVLAQIHDASSDLVRIQTEVRGGALRICARHTPPGSPDEDVYILIDYTEGQWVEWEINVSGGEIEVVIDGVSMPGELDGVTLSADTDGCYYKAGCYAQSNVDDEGEDPDDYFAVEVEAGSFGHWHTGWATNTEPVYTGPTSGVTTHRFYLADEANAWGATAALAFWENDDAALDPQLLANEPTGPGTSAVVGETSDLDTYYTMVRQFVSHPADHDGTLTGSFRLTVGVQESDPAANFVTLLGIWVTQGNTAAIRGSAALNGGFGETEWPSAALTGLQLAAPLGSDVAFLAGDRLVIEVGYLPNNTDPTEYIGGVYYGGTGTTDLEPGDTEVDQRPAWIDLDIGGGAQFVDQGIPGTAAASLGALAATATGGRATPGTATAELGGFVASAEGTVSQVRANAPLGGLAATAAGVRSAIGTAGAPLGALAATATGVRQTFGTASALLGGLLAVTRGESISYLGAAGPALNPAVFLVDPATHEVTEPLPLWERLTLSPIANSPGSCSLTASVGVPGFDVLFDHVSASPQRDQEIEVWLAGSREHRMRWLLQQKEGDELTPAALWTFTGVGLVQLLAEILVGPQGTETQELVFDGVTYGTVLITAVQQAQARDADILDGVTWDFTTTHDSNGEPWASSLAGLAFAPDATLLDVAGIGPEEGVAEFAISPDRVLQAWNFGTRGADRSTGDTPLRLSAAQNLSQAARRESSRVGDAATAALAKGADGVYQWASDSTAEAERGRRVEAAVDAGQLSSPGGVLAAAQGRLDVLKGGSAELVHGVEFGPGLPIPGVDYEVGDWGLSITNNTATRRRITQWTLTFEPGSRARGTVRTDSLIADQLVKLIRQLDGMRRGGVVVGTSHTPPPVDDGKAPAQVQGLVASSSAYTDADGATWASVQAGWSEVVTNADGTAADDIDAYLVQYRYVDTGLPIPNEDWHQLPPTQSLVLDWDTVLPGRQVLVQVAAQDRWSHVGAWSDSFGLVTSSDDEPPPVLSAPVASNYLGMMRGDWDGLGASGEAMPGDFLFAELLASKVNDFTEADEHEVITQLRGASSYVWSPEGSLGDPDYGTTWYIKLRSVDRSGNRSALSEQDSAVPGQVEEGDVATVNVGSLVSGSLSAVVANLGMIYHGEQGEAGYQLDDFGLRFYDDTGVEVFSGGGPDGNLHMAGVFETNLDGSRVSVGPGNPDAGVQVASIRVWADDALDPATIFAYPDGVGASPSTLTMVSSSNGDFSGRVSVADDVTQVAYARAYDATPEFPNGYWLPAGGFLRVDDDSAQLQMSTATTDGTNYRDGGFVYLDHDEAWLGVGDESDATQTYLRVDKDDGTIYTSTVGGLSAFSIHNNGAAVRIGASDYFGNPGDQIIFYWTEDNSGLWIQRAGGGDVKTFVIDHPTDPDRWLVHGCVEGPTADVFYRGTAEIVAGGRAVVELPGYFEAATRPENRQVQLTPIGLPCLVAASPVEGGRFTIVADAADGTQVAWLVHAERADVDRFDAEPLRSDVQVGGMGPYRFINNPKGTPDAQPSTAARADPGGRGDRPPRPADRGPDRGAGEAHRAAGPARRADRLPARAAGREGPAASDRRPARGADLAVGQILTNS
jgi:hypothetical protein